MKVRDIMTSQVVRIHGLEPVEAAARTLTHYNIGMLPVCGSDGRLCGVVTDRDLVIRCMAPGRSAGEVKVQDVMTNRVITVGPDMDVSAAVGSYDIFDSTLPTLSVLEPGKCVMEVKYTEFLPKIIREILPDRASEFTALSKYVLCYEKTEYLNSFNYWYET